MKVIHVKQLAILVGLVFVICLPAEGQKRKAALRLTDEDKKAIVSAVIADGLEELNAKIGGSAILDSCPNLILADKKVSFFSRNNVEAKYVPEIAGAHFEFMTPSEIEDAVKANDQHCYFEFSKFEVVGPKVEVMFGKYLKRPVKIFGEAFRYEYTKVAGKWKGKYIGRINIGT